jgi:hypothetical protein
MVPAHTADLKRRRQMNLKNLSNEYQQALGALFGEMPKAVLAAVAVSAFSNGGDDLAGAAGRIAAEWDVLHANGIVPQKPGKIALSLSRHPVRA